MMDLHMQVLLESTTEAQKRCQQHRLWERAELEEQVTIRPKLKHGRGQTPGQLGTDSRTASDLNDLNVKWYRKWRAGEELSRGVLKKG
eukprot:4848236-Amphidinium_carterae.1